MELSVDRISQLPEPIMLNILFRLPKNEDAIRMSLVSKTWQKFWNSQPAERFDFNSDTGQPNSYYRPTNPLPKRRRLSTSKNSPIEESFQILNEVGDRRKSIIDYFRLRGRVPSQDRSWHVDRWINLATKHFVKELHLQFTDATGVSRYRFPPTRIDVGSLVVLSLTNCVLEEALVEEGMRFCCLKELRLCFVDLNGLVNRLLALCPSLETLELFRCHNTRGLEVDSLKKQIKRVIYSEVL